MIALTCEDMIFLSKRNPGNSLYSHWESSCTNAPNSFEIPLSHSLTSVYPQGNLLCIFLRELSINSPVLSCLFLSSLKRPSSLRPFSLFCFSSLLMAQVPINAESSMTPGHGFGAFWRLYGQKTNRPLKLRRRQLGLSGSGCSSGR